MLDCKQNYNASQAVTIKDVSKSYWLFGQTEGITDRQEQHYMPL